MLIATNLYSIPNTFSSASPVLYALLYVIFLGKVMRSARGYLGGRVLTDSLEGEDSGGETVECCSM